MSGCGTILCVVLERLRFETSQGNRTNELLDDDSVRQIAVGGWKAGVAARNILLGDRGCTRNIRVPKMRRLRRQRPAEKIAWANKDGFASARAEADK